jgi:tetratricopeptide (TPR) repeat protein
LNLITIYFTATRSAILAALLGVIICILYVFISNAYKLKEIKLKRLVMFFVVIIIIIVVFIPLLKGIDIIKNDYTLSRITNLFSDASVKTRLNAWKMAWNGIKEKPILGWGQENFIGIYTVNSIPTFDKHIWVDRAHNIIIDWTINAGVFGLFSYLIILVYAMHIVRISYYQKKIISKPIFLTIFTAQIVYFIQNLFTFDTINTYLLFFTLLAYIDNFNIEKEELIFKKKIEVVKKNTILKPVLVTFSALLVFSSLVYYVNYKPVKASQLTVQISNTFPQYKSFSKLRNDFNDALSYETFGNTDIRQRMAGASSQIIKYKLFEVEGAVDFIQWTLEQLAKSIKDNYYNLDYISQMIKLYYEVARFEPLFTVQAEKLIKKCIQINPDFEPCYFRLADVYLLKRDYEKAFKLIVNMVAEKPLNDRKQLKLAEVAVLASRESVAERALENVRKIRMVKNNEIALKKQPIISANELYMIAKSYLQIKNYDKALELFKKITIILPENARYHFEIAEIYLKLGDVVNAEMELNKAADLDPLNYSDKAMEIY